MLQKTGIFIMLVVALAGCGNTYSIKTYYRNKPSDETVQGEYRSVETTVEGRGGIGQIERVFRRVFSVVNDEVMYKRKEGSK